MHTHRSYPATTSPVVAGGLLGEMLGEVMCREMGQRKRNLRPSTEAWSSALDELPGQPVPTQGRGPWDGIQPVKNAGIVRVGPSARMGPSLWDHSAPPFASGSPPTRGALLRHISPGPHDYKRRHYRAFSVSETVADHSAQSDGEPWSDRQAPAIKSGRTGRGSDQ
jgi:hypothetical protein